MKMSIRWQLMGIASAIVAVIFIGFFAISKMVLVDNFEERTANNDALLADVLSRSIANSLQAADDVAGVLSVYPELWQLPNEQQQAMLQSVVQRNPKYELLALVDMNGQQIARSFGENGDRSGRAWFRQFQERKQNTLSTAYFSASTGDIIVTLTEGIQVNGAPVGLIMADISTKEIQRGIAQYSSTESCQMYLLDDSGNAIISPENEKDGGIHNYYDMTCTKLVDTPAPNKTAIAVSTENFSMDDEMLALIRRSLNDESYHELMTQKDDTCYFMTHRDVVIPSLGVNWHLVILRDYNQAMLPVQNTMDKTMWLGLLGFVLMLIGIGYFSRHLNRALMRLTHVVEKVAEGNYTAKAEVNSKDDLGVLSRNINAMIEKLRRQHQEEQEIRNMANHDVLTGLPNRAYFLAYIRRILYRACKQNHHGALLFVDVDYFKEVNDSYGHAAGDKVLIEVGSRLKIVAGREELVCRFGGDEFLVFLPGANEQELAQRAKAIVNVLKVPFDIGEQTIRLSGSVGAAFYLKDAKDVDDLIFKADMALYKAKANGRGCYMCYEQTEE